jgi:taurine dioxygenase
MRPDESQALLDFLLAQPRIPEFQLRVSWEPGTIVLWDNETTQHYLVLDKAYDRVMHRVMVS